MNKTDTPKGYATLMEAYNKDLNSGARPKTELDRKLKWVLDRANQYARTCDTTREVILKAWEEKRSYWWLNYYQDCNQPDLEKKREMPVVTVKEWMEEGRWLFGEDPKQWKFRCPACGHVQTMNDFSARPGLDIQLAYQNCASRHGLGGKDTCKYTTGGLFRLGRYVINEDYVPVLVFPFAIEEN